MKQYKHKNLGSSAVIIYDSKGEGYALKPGQEKIIDRICGGGNVIITEEKPKRPIKKTKVEDELI